MAKTGNAPTPKDLPYASALTLNPLAPTTVGARINP